ncbi:MAG TPA: hybrid sensor histidine kinase/response regulator [Desulfobacteraceae bacterium]|nr:hybrid sensor histidine kinase/response regulator [Desulfobacteraceae bacterium]
MADPKKNQNQDRIYTILLVDDEAGIRNVLNITLTHAGFRVLLAPDGEQGLSIFREKKPDIVITDIKMPGIDGIELLRRIKQTSPETEVIMITGHGDMDLAVKSLQYEAADFITKPIDSEELEVSVGKAVDRISINARIRSYMDDLKTLIREKDRKLDESENLVTIGQTVAGMSHVIKNIAGGLKGSSFILEQGIENENREYLVKGWEMMKGNIDKITNLSLDLLNYAKTSRLKLKKTNPNHPVNELLTLLAHRAQMQGIALTMTPLDAEVTVSVDCTAIYNALFNLVTNAFDSFAGVDDEREPKVSIEVENEDNCVIYRVQDNGCGMEPDIARALFKEFITTKGTHGTGFGLMTTKKIIDEHRGQIRFDTQKGKGSVFIVTIPADPVTVSEKGR